MWAQLDSIGGADNFNGFAGEFTAKLAENGVDPSKVSVTFRDVGRGEFAMKGKTFA